MAKSRFHTGDIIIALKDGASATKKGDVLEVLREPDGNHFGCMRPSCLCQEQNQTIRQTVADMAHLVRLDDGNKMTIRSFHLILHDENFKHVTKDSQDEVSTPDKECICPSLLWGHLNDCPFGGS